MVPPFTWMAGHAFKICRIICGRNSCRGVDGRGDRDLFGREPRGPGVTCVVDSDTWWDRGVKYRHEHINGPEISRRNARCKSEIALGLRARDRLRELMSGGFQTVPSGRKGKYRRELATIRLADGREAGEVLVSEGLANWYGIAGVGFCRRYPGVQF